jgi:hypothetical protein
MGHDQLFLALIFISALSGGLGYFAGLVHGYGKGIIDMSQKTNKDLEK